MQSFGKTKIIACGLFAALSSVIQAGESAREFAIKYYIGPQSNSNLVFIAGGSNDGLIQGMGLTAFRSHPLGAESGPSTSIETGHVTLIQVEKNHSIAEVTEQGTALSVALFPKFPGVMAGDQVKIPRLNISRSQKLLPRVSLSYKDLFEDPSATPASFELSDNGKKILAEAVREYGSAYISSLFIQGYTDEAGPAEANQIESYERARTVKQYMVQSLGFDDKRVNAVGFGELDSQEEGTRPMSFDARRIEIEVVSAPEYSEKG